MTLDQEPKETAWEEKAVCLLLYVFIGTYVYVTDQRSKKAEEDKTVGELGEKSKG